MKKETIKKHVAEQFPFAKVEFEDEDKIWFSVEIVSSKSLTWARLPYVQILPRDSKSIYMVVSEKF